MGITIVAIATKDIVGSSPFFPFIGVVMAIIAAHWIFADLSFRYDSFGALAKGRPHPLVKDREIHRGGMRRGHVSLRDLRSALRTEGVSDISEAKGACLERSGEISVLRKPQVVEIKIVERVQIVRVQIEV
jgi:uncharacterized membrane protein YcaP (DUF421 family)